MGRVLAIALALAGTAVAAEPASQPTCEAHCAGLPQRDGLGGMSAPSPYALCMQACTTKVDLHGAPCPVTPGTADDPCPGYVNAQRAGSQPAAE